MVIIFTTADLRLSVRHGSIFAYVSVNTHKGLYDMLGVNLYHKWSVCFIGARFSSQTFSLAKLTFAVPECTTTEDHFQVKNNVFTVMHLQWKSKGLEIVESLNMMYSFKN